MLNKVILLIIIAESFAEEGTVRKGRDSYLDALKESHAMSTKEGAKLNANDRESKYSPFDNQPPPSHYGAPQDYPNSQYPPSGAYGPPAPHYGPPQHIPRYIPYPAPIHQSYGVPHAMLGFIDKLHLKLDIFTILKIILKLVIFKKIVSFIALVCLLLFIPKFKVDKEDSDDPDARSLTSPKLLVDEKINTLTQYVLGAIENYSAKTNNGTCDDIYCQSKRMFHNVDAKFSYKRLLEWYFTKEN